jgi:hypothetical protein
MNLNFQCRSTSQKETTTKKVANSETPIDFQRTERCYIAEDRTVQGDLTFSRLWIWSYVLSCVIPHSLLKRY